MYVGNKYITFILFSLQAGPKYRDSDSGIDSWINSTYKHPLNKPAIQLS